MVGDIFLNVIEPLVDFFVGGVSICFVLCDSELELLKSCETLFNEFKIHIEELRLSDKVLKS